MKTLLIDHGGRFLRPVSDLSEALGYDLVACENGTAGLENFRADRPPVVLLSWDLPDMEGVEACRRIRSAPGGDLPSIVMLGAPGEAGDLDRGLAAGANDCVIGPSELADLRTRLAFAMRRVEATERMRAEEHPDATEERLALAVPADGPWGWDLETDEVSLSDRWKATLGLADGEGGEQPSRWLDLVHPADRARLETALEQHSTGKTPHFECSHRVRRSDGDYMWVLSRGLAARDEAGKAKRLVGSLTQLSEHGVHDHMTGLPTRTLFREHLRLAAARWRRRPEMACAVLQLLVDRKAVDEELGREFGDRLLVEVSRRLETQVRETDTLARADVALARAGGDEFLVLLEELERPEDALRVARRIRATLMAGFDLAGQEVHTSPSIGIALSREQQDAFDLESDAGIALHEARSRGEGQIQIFDPKLQAQANERLSIEHDLQHAVGNGELRAFYQPILSLDSGRVVGCEALVRWEHPEQGLIPPARFVPVAESCGLILALDNWVLEEASRQLRSWEQQLGRSLPLSVNVNLSSRHFVRGDVVQEVRDALERAGGASDRLKVEITESSMMENPELAARALDRLRELGIRICVDDFGTGYSSLSYLQRFPVDVLKIDRSFVNELGKEGKQSAIVKAIVSLADHLDLDVVAEGIETREQLSVLREMGCAYGQGFLFSKPVKQEDAGSWLTGEPAWAPVFH